MASTIFTDAMSVIIVILFITFVYARVTKKEMGDIADDLIDMIRGGKKDDKQ